MAKYGMSMCALGMAEEFKTDGIAVNALWPQTSKFSKTKIECLIFILPINRLLLLTSQHIVLPDSSVK